MADYQYIACHSLTRQQLAPPLRFNEPSWTELVNGNGQFSGTVALPTSPTSRALLKQALEPDISAIYIKAPDGSWPFGGPIIDQDWDSRQNSVTVTAVDWRSWLYAAFLGPKLDLTADNLYGWTAIDQLQIARDIVTYATAGGVTDGRPTIALASTVSGKLRDLNIKGLDFKYAGELLDTISRRSGGFEWDIEVYANASDGLPSLRLNLGFPELGATPSGLLLRATPTGGNMSINGTIKRSSSGRRTRVWTTGNTESMPFAVDSDPNLATSGVLLREKVSAHSTVIDRTTLASHARSERQFLTPMTNFLSVTVREDAYDVWGYRAGDRARIVYSDAWEDRDLAAARILERKVSPAQGAGTVEMVIDLEDIEEPQVDETGAV